MNYPDQSQNPARMALTRAVARLTKLEKAIAQGLYRRMPVEGCHHGRGWGHSETCFRSCYDSWRGDVNEIAHILSQNRKGFDRDEFVKLASNAD